MKYHIVPVTFLNQNCSIIWCEISNQSIIVDPGGEQEKLYEAIDKLQVEIVKIVLTHGHIDHVAAALELKKHYGVPLVGPNKDDQFLLKDLFFQNHILNINTFINNDSIIPDVWLEDGDQIKVGYEVFDVLHCPGHSPGHIVLWNKLRKFIVMGDVLFRKNIGRSDLPGGNFEILMRSIKTKLLPLGDDVVFLPGHGAISTIGYERAYNTFLQ